MKKQLRPYQQEICQAIVKSWARGERPYASVMGGLGKSLIAAGLTNRFVNQGNRVLQLVPRLELVEQNYAEARGYLDMPDALGIVCGQLGKRQNNKQAIIAMTSSFVNLRTKSGAFDILICDEAHRIRLNNDPQGKRGIYDKIITSLLRINPNMKVCGLTATPYRLDQGELHEKSHKTAPFFTHKVYDTSVHPGIPALIEAGYLSHIDTLNTSVSADLTGVRLSGRDYNKTEAGVKFDVIIEDAVNDMRYHFDENSIETAIIFVSTINNAKHVLEAWGDNSTMRIVCGDESICTKSQRNDTVKWIKTGTGKRYIVNVDILAEGFDHKALSCVVLLRATTSPGLMVQMIVRAIRPHDDKRCGYLLDYGSNVERLGTIDNIIMPKRKVRAGDAPKKLCLVPGCGEINILGAKVCKKCGAEFVSENEDGLYSMRTKVEVLKAKIDAATERHDVDSVTYELAHSRKDGAKMIKQLFHAGQDDNFELLHTNYIFKDSLEVFMLGNIKNIKDFYALGAAGKQIDNVLMLLHEHPHYFKKISAVILVPNGKFMKIKDVVFYKS